MAETQSIGTPPDPVVEIYARHGSRFTDDQAKIIFEEVTRLPEEDRTAKKVARLARDGFVPRLREVIVDVDTDAAASRYYEDRARKAMNAVQIRLVTEQGVTERPAFYSLEISENPEGNNQRSYLLYSEVQSEEGRKARIVSNIWKELESFRGRARIHREILLELAPDLAALMALADEISGNGEHG